MSSPSAPERQRRRLAAQQRAHGRKPLLAGQHRGSERHQRLAQYGHRDGSSRDERHRRRGRSASRRGGARRGSPRRATTLCVSPVVMSCASPGSSRNSWTREREAVVQRPLERHRRSGHVGLEIGDHVALVEQVLERLVAQLEVPPPRRLALAAVVEQQVCRSDVARPRQRRPRRRRRQAQRSAARSSARASGIHFGGPCSSSGSGSRRSSKSTPNCARPPGASRQQPVAERERRRAVLLVVGADRLEQLLLAGLQPASRRR